MKDISKEKPKDLKPGKLETTTGTCKFCKNLVAIKAELGATEEERNAIASNECTCKDAKDAHDIEVSVSVLKDKINERYKGMPEAARHALISCLKPVAYGMLETVTVKVNSSVSIKVFRSTKGLNLKRTVKQDDIMDEWSPD